MCAGKVIAPVYAQLSTLYPQARFLKVDIDEPALERTVMENGIASVVSTLMHPGHRRCIPLFSQATSMWQFVRDCVILYRSHTQPFTRFDIHFSKA